MPQQTFSGVPAAFTAGQVLTSADMNKLRQFLTYLIKDGTETVTGSASPLRLDLTNASVGVGGDGASGFVLKITGKTQLVTGAVTTTDRAITVLGSSHATSEFAGIDFQSAAGVTRWTIAQDMSGAGTYDFSIRDNTATRFYIDASGLIGLGKGTTTAGTSVNIATGTSSTGVGLLIDASTHATSRRSALKLDNWTVAQDSAANGTKNFYIYSDAAAASRFDIGTDGVVNAAVGLSVAGVGAFAAPFTTTGTLTTGTGQPRLYMNRAGTITGVRISIGTPPVGLPVIADINKNGTTIYSTQANRPAFKSTNSATSTLIGTGSKTFTVATTAATAGAFAVNDIVRILSAANSANFMVGTITAYTTTSMTVNVTSTGGSGTLTDWRIRLETPVNFVAATNPDILTFAAGDYFTVDIDSVGTLTPGSDLIVQFEYE